MAKNRTLGSALEMTPSLSSFLDGSDPGAKNVEKKKQRARPPKKVKAEPQYPSNARVPLSIRVQANVAQKLLEVSTKRKLAKQAPWSQQDITQVAIEEWLKRNG